MKAAVELGRRGGVIVTGGGSGLGEAVARRLRAEGMPVLIADLNPAAAKLATEIGAEFAVTDVSSEKSVQDAVHRAVGAFGTLSGAVNCAGIAIAQKVISKKGVHPLESFMKVLAVNLGGTFNVARLAANQMQNQQPYTSDGERGVIINTASIAAFDGQIGQAAYASSKGGVVAMTLPLAREFASLGIRVVGIAPGTFATPMLQGLPEAARQQLASVVPFPKRLGGPSEFASLVLEILRNPMLNGEVIRIDGALRMQ